MIETGGQVRLIDFGIARLFKPQKRTDTTALGTTGLCLARALYRSDGCPLGPLLAGRYVALSAQRP